MLGVVYTGEGVEGAHGTVKMVKYKSVTVFSWVCHEQLPLHDL